jgi:hypothetical protein
LDNFIRHYHQSNTMFTKISVASIVKDHINTLKSNQTNRIYYPDIFLFFFLPAILSGLMVYFGISLNDSLVNALITSFSIFSALLFNLLLLVYDIAGKDNNKISATDPLEVKKNVQRRELLRQIYVNVSFSILISIVSVVVLLVYFLRSSNCVLWMVNLCSLQWLLATISYYLSIQFLLTIFMVLKRIYKLLAKAFS